MSVNLSTDQFQQLLAAIGGGSSKSGTLAACTASYDGSRDSETLEAFLAAVNVYKAIEHITEADAVTGLPLLLQKDAATWWQGIKHEVKAWAEFERRVRLAFVPKKPAYMVYQEIMGEKQTPRELTEIFVARKRVLFAQLPEPAHTETQQIDMIYGLMSVELRRKMSRSSIRTFEELIGTAREMEQIAEEQKRSRPSDHSETRERCGFCRSWGHMEDVCRKRQTREKPPAPRKPETPSAGPAPKFACYGCGTPGVVRSRCPKCQSNRAPPPNTEGLSFCALNTTDARRRPTVMISVAGHHGVAHVDSCAKSSVASYQLYKVLLEEGYQFSRKTVTVTLADGFTRKQEVFTIQLPVRLGELPVLTTFIVFPESRDNRTLLDVGFIQDAGLVLNIPQMTWSLLTSPETTHDLLYEEEDIPTGTSSVTALEHQSQTPSPIRHMRREIPMPALLSPMEDTPPHAPNDYPAHLVEMHQTTPKRSPTTLFDGYSPYHDAQMASFRADTIFPEMENIEIGSLHIFESALTCDDEQHWEEFQHDAISKTDGLVNKFATIAEPLTLSTEKSSTWIWNQGKDEAFDSPKEAYGTAPVLQQADDSKAYKIKTDASQYALGAFLVQGETEDKHPAIGVYHSSALKPYYREEDDLPPPVAPIRKRGRPRRSAADTPALQPDGQAGPSRRTTRRNEQH
jgi:hypothetical protein